MAPPGPAYFLKRGSGSTTILIPGFEYDSTQPAIASSDSNQETTRPPPPLKGRRNLPGRSAASPTQLAVRFNAIPIGQERGQSPEGADRRGGWIDLPGAGSPVPGRLVP